MANHLEEINVPVEYNGMKYNVSPSALHSNNLIVELPGITVKGKRKKTYNVSTGGQNYKSSYDRNFVKNTFEPIIDFIPGIGDAKQAFEAGEQLYNKDYNNAAITAGLLLAPNFIEKPIKYFKKLHIGNRLSKLGHKPYESVTRFHGDSPVRSSPIMDIFRLQIPSFKSGELGYGNYYRSIGGKKGLDDAIKHGFRGKHPEYQQYGHTYWSKDEPLREYTKNSPLMVSYDKNGPYQFGKGNFDNPISGTGDIKFNDPNVRLYGRYPFWSKYHEIPKTQEGIKHARTLADLNKYVETPVRRTVKGYLGYKLYDWYNND